jgi:hypothetical protein
VEISTFRSLEICAIRRMLIPLRWASRISSLHSLKARSWPICGTGRLSSCDPLGPDISGSGFENVKAQNQSRRVTACFSSLRMPATSSDTSYNHMGLRKGSQCQFVKLMLEAALPSPLEQPSETSARESVFVPGAAKGRFHECAPTNGAAAGLDFAKRRGQ